ncbi:MULTISPECIES: sensor histidine kinase KdpD [unclassified Streptomyces]|uniref:sensor histidine kinase n=1 Tax=unclassified Streptomyces TaxID=2593676 RepID=UPI001F31A611|nr:sensor histidine kinase [Streptomyces sp. NRRL F-5727]
MAPVWLVPPGVLAALFAIGLLFAPAQIRTPVAWYGFAAVSLTVGSTALTVRLARAAEAARHTRTVQAAQQAHAERENALLARLADQRTTTVWLAEELLPAAVARLQKGDAASEIVNSVRFGDHLDDGFTDALRGALRTLLEAVEAEENTRDSSQRALVAVARRVQAIVHQLAKDLREMQIVHGTDLVLARGLQDVDHRNALIGRLAASIAVLGDARPGRQWSKPIPLYDVLRGAMSRIVDYPRVKLQSVTEAAVIGPGAEPLIHLLAELLDNATSFSPPHTPVEVSAVEVPSGIAIEIEDRGVGLTEEVRHRINRVMTESASGMFLAGLGEVTQLGLPVVSRLAREHGCDVDLRPSAYGGVRAVILVPRRLITTVEKPVVRTPEPARKRAAGPIRPLPKRGTPSVPPPAPAPLPVPPPAPAPLLPSLDDGADPFIDGKTLNGLPRRRRDTPVPTPVVRTGPEPAPAPRASAREPGLMWEAFNADKHAGTDSPTPHSKPSDEVE